MEMDKLKELTGKVMIKNGDTTTPDGERYEMATITKGADGGIEYKRVSKSEVDKILTAAKAKEDAEAPNQ